MTSIKQTLISNGFPNYINDQEVKMIPRKYITVKRNHKNYTMINLSCCHQMHNNYKKEKKVMKNIIHRCNRLLIGTNIHNYIRTRFDQKVSGLVSIQRKR